MGKPLRDKMALIRIRRLAIPPAWTDVWISPHENGHLQATGRDCAAASSTAITRAGGRCATRPSTRHDSLRRVPCRRSASRLRQDLSARGLSRRKVLATVVRLLETTLIRVGNDEYARTNDSYGLTTMRPSTWR